AVLQLEKNWLGVGRPDLPALFPGTLAFVVSVERVVIFLGQVGEVLSVLRPDQDFLRRFSGFILGRVLLEGNEDILPFDPIIGLKLTCMVLVILLDQVAPDLFYRAPDAIVLVLIGHEVPLLLSPERVQRLAARA